ncbi:hypothetical protein [Cyclobacterium sp.]|uniref:hypothetical protein n=1 Tax=Cyclobacterium sp. TaxID=1966343 RepID=UPI001999FF92|nr:hypothetical protein [Cyclobacterium sp.]MBD3630881.1 hypothetical protein [Cyclobacterium sp.]
MAEKNSSNNKDSGERKENASPVCFSEHPDIMKDYRLPDPEEIKISNPKNKVK